VVNIDTENKKYDICPLIPGERSEHVFVAGQEAEYYQMYQQSWFAHTKKKGGWDCLRHYEILANGCIPLFENLDDCPEHTLATLPKQLLKQAQNPVDMDHADRRNLIQKLLEHTREHCSTSANTKYVLSKIKHKNPRNVFLIVGNCGVNYTRELFWIGMKRYLQSLGHGDGDGDGDGVAVAVAVAVEYPHLDYLYDDYPTDKKRDLHGNGFTYTGKLTREKQIASPQNDETEIIEKIKNKFFDLIVYGKVGPDEGAEGSLEGFTFWEHVFKRYSRDEIVCLYGGDECVDLKVDNDYSRHIYLVAQYATCFVRELRV
jgi:hypothetical protein